MVLYFAIINSSFSGGIAQKAKDICLQKQALNSSISMPKCLISQIKVLKSHAKKRELELKIYKEKNEALYEPTIKHFDKIDKETTRAAVSEGLGKAAIAIGVSAATMAATQAITAPSATSTAPSGLGVGANGELTRRLSPTLSTTATGGLINNATIVPLR